MKTAFAIVSLALFSLTAHAALNKWVDAEGNVHYSDTVPPNVKVETVPKISGTGQPAAPATYSTKNYAEREAELKKAKREKAETNERKSAEQARAEEKQQNCANAQENLKILQAGSRITTYDANGERTFLDDGARKKRLEDSQKAAAINCN